MKEKYNILIVDDEKDLCEILQFNLMSEGFDIDVAHSGEEALKKPLSGFDLILLDVMMSGASGYRVADKIRRELQLNTPIIFLTAKTGENDMLTGFNVGGDDYISKPFSIKEVVARIKAVLKRGRNESVQTNLIRIDDLSIDLERKTLKIYDEPINLTRKEFEILALLIANRGKYIEREEILNRAWSDDVIVTERNVDVNIARLRKKIGEYGDMIKGKSGYGYSFEI
ncbi:MAG: DNA-binding response regulator [Bacteroidetes bacterium GWF2_42_66]|nr:MAG: DNA-binding response regulator [Bacteroidetes bacterium GWA2_42_15]OFX98469.1 MAG: DNA-binding response regulator [Bacteroidetes bacterium GWE2_42_39]OFY42854.1 MAG: DNA-binding response regulator [Bacteroidetes bacterium GWF2_42_66]HBL74483.1 DNA-binding response regulator [Prolixibacteraceae bacterium]HCR89021.1 DNA-binding response regulator [Prolixibacteraceae bacterium]